MNTVKNNDDKIIIFEFIGYLSLFTVIWYLWKKSPIRYFGIDPTIERLSFFKKYYQKNQFNIIELRDVDFNQFVQLDNCVLDELDIIYKSDFSNNTTITLIKTLLKSPCTDLIFKKMIALKALDLYQKMYLIETISKNAEHKKIIFFPDQSYDLIRSSPILNQKFKNFEKFQLNRFLTVFYKKITNFFQILKYCGILFVLPVWLIYKVGMPSLKKEARKSFDYCIKIKGGDWAFNKEDRSIDFLLDGKKISKENTCFCIITDIPDKYTQDLKDRQYFSIELKKILHGISIRFLHGTILQRFIPVWFACLGKSLTQPWFIMRLNLEIFQRFLFWSAFHEKYRIKHYITYDEYVPTDSVANILMTQNDVKTWFYLHSISTFDVFTPQGSRQYREALLSFFYYDCLVAWGNNVEHYFQSNPNYIKKYQTLGCLWSEPIMNRIVNRSASSLLTKALLKFSMNTQPSPKKIISVFDTSFGKKFGQACFLTSENMIQFINDILRLLDEHPEIGVIFKNKKSWQEMEQMDPAVLPAYRILKDHPRCYLTENMQVDSSEIIAVSDLIIAACFTSPAIEALGARKKALFLDSSTLFNGTYYDKFPNLVAHGYTELKTLAHYWLDEISDNEFNNYLDNSIKGELDSFVDGKAITRFREILAAENK